jgi:hypothetical protein
MHSITIVCKRDDTPRITQTLARAKAIHLTTHQRETIGAITIDNGNPQADAERIAQALTATRTLLARFPTESIPESTVPLARIIDEVEALIARWKEHETTLAHIAKERESLHATQLLLERLIAYDAPLTTLFASRRVTAFLVEQPPADLPRIGETPLPLTPPTSLIVAKPEDAPLWQPHAVDLAPIRHLTGTARQELGRIAERTATLRHEEERERHAETSFAQHAIFLAAAEPVLATELLIAQAPLRFGTTARITIINGFLPTKRVAEMEAALADCLIDTAPAHEAPVLLENPTPATPFEALIRMYALPKYHEIDPTRLMAFTFPLFFGFMLGDIGYGLCALLLAIVIAKTWPIAREFARIFMLSAASAILFGIVFGEAFGAEEILGFHLTPLLHRTGDPIMLFAIAACIGLAHLNLGLLLGMMNESRDGWFFAITKKGSWMLLQAGLLIMLAGTGIFDGTPASFLHQSMSIGILLTAIAIGGIVWSEGFIGVLEMPGIISNTMSYMRLVALGIASVSLAMVVNGMGSQLMAQGGAWSILAVLILVVGHAINLALGLLGPFLHSLRLHYVEFFTKFYEGGGSPYRPFGGTA